MGFPGLDLSNSVWFFILASSRFAPCFAPTKCDVVEQSSDNVNKSLLLFVRGSAKRKRL